MAIRRDVDGSLGVFAGELRFVRAKGGLSQEELASRINYSPSLVAMVETGKRMPSPISRNAAMRRWTPAGC